MNAVIEMNGMQLSCTRATASEILHYVNHRIRPGRFVQAVIENDLMTAIEIADAQDRLALPQTIRLLKSEAPADAYGSPDNFRAWIKLHD